MLEALREDTRPTLMLWADSDPDTAADGGRELRRARSAAPPPRAIEDACHFLQEDQGPLIGQLIAEWLLER